MWTVLVAGVCATIIMDGPHKDVPFAAIGTMVDGQCLYYLFLADTDGKVTDPYDPPPFVPNAKPHRFGFKSGPVTSEVTVDNDVYIVKRSDAL
jgi:hypothetical protein